ncbi:MAG TPA: hypothetical protein VK453_25125 [Micromonosporaceae bacterium]|nr:hypothetical protein [Micromonosporaceae bacterium]
MSTHLIVTFDTIAGPIDFGPVGAAATASFEMARRGRPCRVEKREPNRLAEFLRWSWDEEAKR